MSSSKDQIISYCEKELKQPEKTQLVYKCLTRRLYTNIHAKQMERWEKSGTTLKK